MAFINITVQLNDDRRDIKIDSEQKIKAGIEVLRQSGKLPMGESCDYFHSRLNERLVSSYKTFAEEEIYDGDILTAIF
ncbi:MAG: EsaB/YukD family protein [Defluviitaleaceae bacterium]|nr:EsaB/YukD family protein [Defluviitaleaceae bacterium]